MLSAQAIKEIQQAIETDPNGCQLEVQVPNGPSFTVTLQPGRAQQLSNRQQGQQDEGSQQQYGAARRGQTQEWRIRRTSLQGQQGSGQNYQD